LKKKKCQDAISKHNTHERKKHETAGQPFQPLLEVCVSFFLGGEGVTLVILNVVMIKAACG
jgi:hypothetical protein